jgi:two-component system, OmpR family, response regulator
MPRVLIVDDDPHIRAVVRFALEREGFAVSEAADGAAGLAAFRAGTSDLLILDVTMPELNGTELCRLIRRESDVPVIFLSSRDEEIDRVLGLELGADDYVTKPFSPRELVARVRSRLRLRRDTQPTDDALRCAALSMDVSRFEAHWAGAPLPLTRTEFRLLHAMARRPGIVFTREMLMQAAHDDARIVSDRTIDSHVRHLRAKLAAVGATPIGTVQGLGYRFTEAAGG